MSAPIVAEVVPYSSTVGSSVIIGTMGGPIIAQLSVLAPSGPPPGEDHRQFSERISKFVADSINSRR